LKLDPSVTNRYPRDFNFVAIIFHFLSLNCLKSALSRCKQKCLARLSKCDRILIRELYVCSSCGVFARDGRAGRMALCFRLTIRACFSMPVGGSIYAGFSSPAARLRDKTRQGDNHSANRKRCSRGSNLAGSICAIIALAVLLLPGAASVYGQANVEGQWQTLSTTMPINPVHVSLMHNGQILVVSGSGNYPPDTNYQAAIWNPSNNSVTTQTIGWDMFCSGMIAPARRSRDVFGGTLQYDPFAWVAAYLHL